MFRSAVDFLRLEKVEIAGVKGKSLSERVIKIFEDFKSEFEKFSNKKYDPLDPDGKVSFFENMRFFKLYSKRFLL
jgi:dynein heavy chain